MMHNDAVDAFVRDFLTALKPALQTSPVRALLAEVRVVCDEFQKRGRGNLHVAVIPLSFWTQFTGDFVDAYIVAADDAVLLLRLREALRSRMEEFARAHDITLEEVP